MSDSRSHVSTEVVNTVIPIGHFYSPIVNPAEVRDYVTAGKSAGPHDIKGIEFHLSEMMQFWLDNARTIQATPFTEERVPNRRFFYKDSQLPYGDAVMLRTIIAATRPKRMIEIGSGFSSVCALDAADEFGMEEFRLTCIEPYPDRLLSLLKEGDRSRIDVIEKRVQEVDLSHFSSLNKNDILFIDSSHVLKTGSDVHYELFHILPTLKPGVLIHFHDCRWPFEYPDAFIFDRNYSWNEAYAIRAFLMWNAQFRIFFYGGLFATLHRELVQSTYPMFLRNFGSSLWVVREGGS